MARMLGVIIVSYKNPQRTIDFINNQLSQIEPKYVVVVVNNASTIDECRRIAGQCHGIVCGPNDIVGKHGVYIVNATDNLGFAKGNNLGVKFLMRNNPCDHLLFSNDDIVIENNTDLTPMIDLLEKDKSIGAIGPDIVGLDGHHQSPHYTVISPYRQIGWLLFPFLRGKKRPLNENAVNQPLQSGWCYWVSGAFFLMRFRHFSAVNGFDPDTFLYSEEPIMAEKLLQLGKKMYFYPNIRVTHLEGGTTKGAIGNNRIMNHIIESNCIYYKKYLHTPKVVVALYKWLALRQWKARVKFQIIGK